MIILSNVNVAGMFAAGRRERAWCWQRSSWSRTISGNARRLSCLDNSMPKLCLANWFKTIGSPSSFQVRII